MPSPLRSSTITLAAALVCAMTPARAASVDLLPVGAPGNACDDQPQGCFGSVAVVYEIGQYEVTNEQYAEFLNGVDPTGANGLELYNPLMEYDPIAELLFEFQHGGIVLTPENEEGQRYEVKTGYADRPVVYVSFYDALRFANWLNNGQGAGSTEVGAYTLLGGAATPSNGLTVTRDPEAAVYVPNEDEWYKAAYYGGETAGYFDYPAASDTPTSCDPPGQVPNSANCNGGLNVGTLTDVGAYTSSGSAHGTYDQGGNAWEWTETLVGSERVLRGGAWDTQASYLGAAVRLSFDAATGEFWDVGFRVASAVAACSNGADDDGDGLVDGADPGCASGSDVSERSPTLVCDDGVDNDGDGRTDYLAAGGGDPGCLNPVSPREDPQCQDGLNNDNQPGIDFDGGDSLDLDRDGRIDAQFNPATPLVGAADPQCVGKPWANQERAPSSGRRCGLGFELVLLVPWLARTARRRRI